MHEPPLPAVRCGSPAEAPDGGGGLDAARAGTLIYQTLVREGGRMPAARHDEPAPDAREAPATTATREAGA